jgi:hypothetical protein
MKRPRKRKLKVGVTLFIRQGQQSLWENGIFQNCYFLLLLLQKSPLVDKAFIVNGGDGDPAEAADFLKLAPAPVIDLDTAQRDLDVVIELSAQLNPDWGRAFKARGGRIVGMRVANDYVIDIERMIFKLPNATVVSGAPYDEIWTLPAFEATCAEYYRTTLRAPVRVMQHLWSPLLLDRAAAEAKPGQTFDYQPGRERWRLAILEPNICSVKTAHLPMMICDIAHRRDPGFIEYLRVYNAMALKERSIFVQFARSLDLVRHGIATFEPRFPLFEVMGDQADAIVAHSWENEQNYLYYEALHGGYPLIHNSRFLADCGYHYPDFDCDEGASALREAFAAHDGSLDDYRRRARTFLQRLDPESDRNVAAYSEALSSLFVAG